MKKKIALLALLVSAGCVATEVQYKVGVTPAQRNRDIAQCNKKATRDYPIAASYYTTPRVWVPARRYCNKNGCQTTGGYWSGGELQSVDRNAQSRARSFGQCMSAKGYQPVALQPCTGDVKAAVQRSTQGRYPRLTEDSCSVGMQDGTLKVHAR